MKKSKKILALVLALVMLMSTVSVSAFAKDGSANLSATVSATEVNIGDTISISVSNAEMTVASFAGRVEFNKEYFECVSIEGLLDEEEPGTLYIQVKDKKWPTEITTVATVANANDNGIAGFAYPSTGDVTYKAGGIYKVTLKALKEGTTDVKVVEDSSGADAYKDVVSTTAVTVKAPTVDVTGVTLNPSTLSLDLTNNKIGTLTATVSPENATDTTVTWTSSNTSVATVDGGVVTAVAAGTATITATTSNDKTATCTVTVVNCLHTQKQLVNEKASTCIEKGWDAYYTCDCGVKLKADGTTVITAVPERELVAHNFAKEDVNAEGALKTAGDCTKPAVYYKSCTVCGNVSTNDTDTFESAYGTHNLTKTEAKAATCTADGNNEYWTCSTCGKVFKTDKTTETTVADENIPAGHEYEFVNEVAATCNKTGTRAHYKCENCLQLFNNNDAKTPVNAEDLVLVKNPNNHTGSQTLQHNETQHWYHCGDCKADYSKANHSGGTATCTEQAKCTTCSQPYGALKAHTLTKTEAKAATCTVAGNNEYYKCSACGDCFKDEAGTQKTTAETEKIAALGHDMTKTEAVAPTCTEDGNNAYWTCGTCNKVFKDEAGNTVTTAEAEKIAALGHQMTKTDAKAATCTEAGNNAYWTCGTCNKVFKDEAGNTETSVETEKIAALGHEYGTQIDEVPATCTKEGTEAHYKCSRCEKLFLDTTSGDAVTASDLVIDKIPHDYKGIYNETHHWTFCVNCGATTDKAAHDFTVDEATGAKTCNCGYVVYGEGTALCDQHDTELVFDETHHWHVCKNCSYAEDKAAHGFGDWETDVEATTTTDGLRHRTCKECGYVQQEVIAKPSTTPSTRPTTRPSGGSNATSSDKVKSSKTFDAGIAAYVGLSVLSLTGSALVIGKKKEF